MGRRATFGASVAAVVVLALGAVERAAPQGPIKLARQPDYHAGRIAFSYLGDIWTASEDGTAVARITDNTAREEYPRFSPDGRWIAFSSNRYGNYDVFVVPAAGGVPTRLTYFSGSDEVVGWTRDSASVVFRASHGDGAFPGVATLYEISVNGGPEKPLPVDWGYWGSFSPDGQRLAFNRHPAVWSRQHYRGSYSADLWIADLPKKTYSKLLPDEKYNRYWPMWGTNDEIYFVGDPLANEKDAAPGSLAVRKSVNNIYKVPVGGGAAAQVTHHTDGSLFFPSMSSDGKVIVYEENFGIWKLDVASGKTSEIKINIATDDKENEVETVNVRNEVDSFDISPSGRRAVISARGQLVTIATDRGDITRIAPDEMASRNQNPKWSADGKYVAFVSDRSGRDEVWITDPDGKDLKKITDLDNEKGPLLWTPDSKLLLYTAADKRLYSYSVADAKATVVASDTVGRIQSVSVSPDSKWIAFSKQDRTLRSHVYIAPIAGGDERHVSDDSLLYSENNAVWTADGRYLVFTSSEGTGAGIASTGGVAATMELWALSLRDQDRDPSNRDIDNEAQALAADAAARQGGAGRGGAGAGAADRRGRAHRLERARASRAARERAGRHDRRARRGAGWALGRAQSWRRRGRTRRRGGRGHRRALHRQRRDRPAHARAAGGARGRRTWRARRRGRRRRIRRRRRGVLARRPHALFPFGHRTVCRAVGGGAAAVPAAGGGAAGRGARGGGAAPTAAEPATGATAREVTYSANLQIDHRALRQQVFNEGWRVMKNRYYDAEMNGVDWVAARSTYASLLDYLVDEEELHTVMMMMIGQLNSSHTGVSGGPADTDASPAQTRYPGFDLAADASGYYKVGRLYKAGPADHDYLKIKEGDFIIAIDDHDLKTSDNCWQYFTLASGSKFHFLINDKPAKEGAWDVTIEPVAGNIHGDLQYARWVEDRRDIVTKLSNGEIGYLHIRAMDAPSLRQFQLDLAANRTKKALIIDQRFNGGGGIDQELLGILAGREYQYTVNRDAGVRQPRPQNFYGPMVVLQNERSASDAEMFPAGFKALGLGKVVGVPTMAAVIGTGSYTLLDGSAIRTPGSGVWLTANGQNMENYGVPPDVLVDNTPGDFAGGHDLQVEKAVEVLKAQMAAGVKK